MHVALVVGNLKDLSGVSEHVRELGEQLAGAGQKVTVFASDVSPGEAGGMRMVPVPDWPGVPQPLAFGLALDRTHRQDRINLVHVQDSVAFLGAHVFARRQGLPVVFTFQASIFSPGRDRDYSWWQSLLYRFTNTFVARHSDGVVCISREMLECARKAGADQRRLHLIPNPIDLHVFGSQSHLPHSPRRTVVLFVGALRPNKGVEYLLRAAPDVLREYPLVRFWIVGDGPERSRLESLARNLGVAKWVRFPGRIERKDLPGYYAQAGVFAMPSLNEPQGLVALEALAFGLPVVASRVGGIPEMVQDGWNGRLVPPGNSPLLAGALKEVLSDPEVNQRMSTHALETARNLSWPRSLGKFLDLYNDLAHWN